jgi:hypothetical protein
MELYLYGNLINKNGDFENESEENLSKLITNLIYILQDVHSIKSKNNSLGNFQKITLKASKLRYEVAIGSSSIRTVKFNQE